MQYEFDATIGTSSERLHHCIAIVSISLRHQIFKAFPRESPQLIQSRLLIQHPRVARERSAEIALIIPTLP